MTRLLIPIGPHDHVDGPADAPHTVVEYGDFECPACGAAFPEVERFRALMGSTIRFVFRHFPLTQVHPHALIAAEAAEAAGVRGRFWDMYRLLFARQDALSMPDLLARARAIGLDEGELESDLVEHQHVAKIRRDFSGGVRSGVNGTPTFFIDGLRHDGPWTFDALLMRVGHGHVAL
jgi:protein-disulfide isomerase